jgi:hypothetical protein
LQFEAWFEVEEQKQKKEKGKRKKEKNLRPSQASSWASYAAANRELYRNNRRS